MDTRSRAMHRQIGTGGYSSRYRTPNANQGLQATRCYTGRFDRRSTHREPRTGEIVEAETNGALPEPGSTR